MEKEAPHHGKEGGAYTIGKKQRPESIMEVRRRRTRRRRMRRSRLRHRKRCLIPTVYHRNKGATWVGLFDRGPPIMPPTLPAAATAAASPKSQARF